MSDSKSTEQVISTSAYSYYDKYGEYNVQSEEGIKAVRELDAMLKRERSNAYDLLYWKYKEMNGQSVDKVFAEAYGTLKEEIRHE